MGRIEEVAVAAEEVRTGDPRSFEREIIRGLTTHIDDFVNGRPEGAEADGRNGVTAQWIAQETSGGQSTEYRVVIKAREHREIITRTSGTTMIQFEREKNLFGKVTSLSVKEIHRGNLRAKKSLVVDLEVLGDSIMHYLSDQGGPVGIGEKFFIRTTRRGSELCTERDPVNGRRLTDVDRRKVTSLVNLRRRVPGARITSRPVVRAS